jgi:hypothetical protein
MQSKINKFELFLSAAQISFTHLDAGFFQKNFVSLCLCVKESGFNRQKNRWLSLVFALFFLLPARLWAYPSVMQRGSYTVARDAVCRDAVVSDGTLVIWGRVEGSVFVVRGNVRVNEGGVVRGNLTVLGGDLRVASGAAVEGEINVFSGRAEVAKGAKTGPEVRVMEQVASLTPEKLAVISRYIIFPRVMPSSDFALSGLGEGLWPLARFQVQEQKPARLDLFELGSVALNPNEIADADEILYRRHEVQARVVAVRFREPAAVEALWSRLRAEFEEKASSSVHNSLGEGAHWFFRQDHATYCLWYRGNTLMAVMTRLDQDHPSPAEWLAAEAARDAIIQTLADFFRSGAEPTAPHHHRGRDRK